MDANRSHKRTREDATDLDGVQCTACKCEDCENFLASVIEEMCEDYLNEHIKELIGGYFRDILGGEAAFVNAHFGADVVNDVDINPE